VNQLNEQPAQLRFPSAANYLKFSSGSLPPSPFHCPLKNGNERTVLSWEGIRQKVSDGATANGSSFCFFLRSFSLNGELIYPYV